MAAAPDRLDWLTRGAVLLLVAAGTMLWVAQRHRAPEATRVVATALAEDAEEIAIRAALGRLPENTGDLPALEGFVDANPGNALAHLFKADLLRLDNRLGDAVGEYRQALRLSRDFADRASPRYRGLALERVVEDGLAIYRREREVRPDDEAVLGVIRDLYALRRGLSGGCD